MTTKRAIGYARISTEGQSNFSIAGQQDAITRYCAQNGWELSGIYTDEGQSAKNFDRAEWKELERYIQKHHKQIDYLVVMKYDRFSRNVSEALNTLQVIEEKYNIRVMSVNENIGLHPQSPFFFQIRATMLLQGDVELRIIRDRTKFGMVEAARKGRFTTTAPFGYHNARDEYNKPILVIDPERSQLVRRAYQMFANEVPMTEIMRTLKPDGYTLNGNSAMRRLLSNPVYTALVRVPSYYDEKEYLAEAIHTPIIDRNLWWRVQSMLNPVQAPRIEYNEEVPLRGALRCHCGRCFTAGNSKGKLKYYWYYICEAHRQTNLSAIKLHSQFDELLDQLNFTDAQVQYLQKQMVDGIQQRLQVQHEKIRTRQKELNQTMADIISLEEKYIRDTVDTDTYKRHRARLEAEKAVHEQEIAKLQQPVGETWEKYAKCVAQLTDIRYLYQCGTVQHKHIFIKTVFNSQLYYQNGTYRTPYLHPLFALKAPILKEKGLLEIEQPSHFSGKIPIGAPGGT
jgi:site-specific DNA recombinase